MAGDVLIGMKKCKTDMEIKLSINKADVLAEVDMATAYIATKAEDGDKAKYSVIATIKENAEKLEAFWSDACSDVAAAAKDFVKEVEVTDTVFALKLEMPDKYNPALDGVLKQRAASYMANAILVQWLVTCGFDVNVVAVYKQDCALLYAGLTSILNTRTSTRAENGAQGENSIGTSDIPEYGGEEEPTKNNTIGSTNIPEEEGTEEPIRNNVIGTTDAQCIGNDCEKTRGAAYGGCMRQNIGAAKAMIIKVRR